MRFPYFNGFLNIAILNGLRSDPEPETRFLTYRELFKIAIYSNGREEEQEKLAKGAFTETILSEQPIAFGAKIQNPKWYNVSHGKIQGMHRF